MTCNQLAGAPQCACAAQDDQLHEECGVFGVLAPGRDVARLAYFGLHALQHRGQESAGIAVGDGGTVLVRKDMGLVTQVFSDADLRAGSPRSRTSPPSTRSLSRSRTTARWSTPTSCGASLSTWA